MVPINLKLSNFTSYGETPQELDFTKFHLAAISGQNGAGKSSLLDAISWCIWGVSRAGESADALIRLGATQMNVEFTFDLDSHTYTIKRQRSKKSGGHTTLEFWSNSHNLTEGTIKATQQKIIDTLHLTYETFSNSSFLRQGNADEFTTKGPTDRKRILADILGLDHYDKLEEKAKDRSKDAQSKLTLLEYKLLELEAELSQKEERQQKYSQIQTEVEAAKLKQKELDQLVKSIEEEKQLIQVTVNSLNDQKDRYESLNKEVLDLKLQIDLKDKAKSEYQLILDKKQFIEKNYQALQDLLADKKVLDQKRSQLIKAKDELVALEKTITDREAKRQAAISDLEIQQKEFQTKVEQLTSQNDILKKQKTVCPTCGQSIGSEINKKLIVDNLKEIQKNDQLCSEINLKIDKFKSVVLPEIKQKQEKELEVKALENQTKSYFELQKQIDELSRFETGYLKLQQAEVTVKTHTEALLDLQKIYQTKQKELTKSQNFEKELSLYSQKLQTIQTKLEVQTAVRVELNQQILELTGQAGQAKELIDRSKQMEKLLKEKSAEKSALQLEKDSYEELALAFGKKGIQAMIIEAAIPEIEDEANSLLNRLTEGRMKVRLDTQKETKTKVQTSAGKIHATVETLDIIISDEMGERSYELYSGGEAFRVNFAIRIAISKLLANRAGAKLQFLVIDEGFGSQDAPGRARLVEVIDTIKNDFEKIVVITHLEELKEEFPTRIEVTKSPSGSTFEIVGN